MIADLLSESVLFATAGLIALPLAARRFRRAFRPREHVRFNAASMMAGLALLIGALTICALPVVTTVATGRESGHHFFVGDTVVGWASAGFAAVAVGSLFFGLLRFRRSQTRQRVEPWVGTHRPRAGYDLVILESDRRVAYALSGKHPQVVMTTGLMTALSPSELDAVLDHELAHIRLGHRRFLALAAALEPAARLARPLQRVLAAARFALERAADAESGQPIATRSALLKLSGVEPDTAMAAFTAGDVAERIQALTEDPERGLSRALRPSLYLAALSLVALSIAALVVYWL